MELKRGDLVTVALPGEYGKPRPALIVQSDLFRDSATVTVVPLTSAGVDAPLFRVPIEPSEANGLRQPSQVMVDKIMTVRVERLGEAFGQLDSGSMLSVNRSLALFLGIGT